MSIIKINYHQLIGDDLTSPFSLDGVGFEPELVYNSVSKNVIYQKCPAWKHKSTRTFLIKSPVDIDLYVDFENQRLYSENLNQYQFDQYCQPTFLDGWCTTEKTTIQLSIPRFIFWTKQKNIWIETRPHFNTVLKNNLTAISGWFNLSSWTRPIGVDFEVVDIVKPIIIKRGDPLIEISFFSKNLDDGVLLKKSFPSQKLIEQIDKQDNVKKYIKDYSNSFMFKNKKSKCPFEFLWK